MATAAASNTDVLNGLLRSRRSIRQFRDEPIPVERIEEIVSLAGATPSAHDAQPWRFMAVTSRDGRHRLADELCASLAEKLREAATPATEITKDVAAARRILESAPAIVCVCLETRAVKAAKDPDAQRAEYLLAVQSVACATMVVLLSATAAGLGSCWISAPLFAAEATGRALDLPPDWEPQALILLGHPAAKPPPREPVAPVVVWR